MKSLILSIVSLLAALGLSATIHNEKAIYIPRELADSNFNDPSSKWSFSRMVSTDNVVLFWAPGFGDNISTAPDLDGNDMRVDLANLLARLEQFYKVFYHDMEFVRPGSKADRYKMMVMLDYSLEGTAYGGDYDGEIGALWIAPNRLRDPKLNCIAHELGHSFQGQVTADGDGEAWGGCGFFEMASQWMLWQVNPDWPTDENYHLNAYRKSTHKAFLHLDNIYRSPYVLEGWSEKYGMTYIAELFRQGKRGEDPVMTHMRIQGLSQEAFCDEMFEIQSKIVNWDFEHARDNMRPYANRWHTDMVDAGHGWYRVAPDNAPENYGFNAVELTVPEPGATMTVDFKGERGVKGYYMPRAKEAGWRYDIVAVDADGVTIQGEMKKSPAGQLTFTTPVDRPLSHLWIVVMGAPASHKANVDGPDNPGDEQHPYRLRFKGTGLKK